MCVKMCVCVWECTVCPCLSYLPPLFCCLCSWAPWRLWHSFLSFLSHERAWTPCCCLWDPRVLIRGGERGEKGWEEEGWRAERGSDRAIVARIPQGLPEHPPLKTLCCHVLSWREGAPSPAPGNTTGSQRAICIRRWCLQKYRGRHVSREGTTAVTVLDVLLPHTVLNFGIKISGSVLRIFSFCSTRKANQPLLFPFLLKVTSMIYWPVVANLLPLLQNFCCFNLRSQLAGPLFPAVCSSLVTDSLQSSRVLPDRPYWGNKSPWGMSWKHISALKAVQPEKQTTEQEDHSCVCLMMCHVLSRHFCCTSNYLLTYSSCKDGTIVCLTDRWPCISMSLWERMGLKQRGLSSETCGESEQVSLTSKLLLPVTGDLAALGLHGLLAVDSCARSFPGAGSTVPFIGHTHAPLPVPTVWLALLLPWTTKQTPLATLKGTF